MSDLNLNKIAAAVLLAGLVGMVAGKASELLYFGEFAHPGGHHGEEKRGYKIEIVEDAGSGGAAAPSGPGDITALLASADANAGKAYFEKKCSVCHDISNGGPNKVGPNLWGVMGRKIASHAGFNYSNALKAHAAETWNFETMNHFQWKPAKFAPGTIMGYGGNPKDQERANLITFLNAQGGNQPLPAVKAAPAAPATKEAPAAH